jgi:hypothetical protein
MSEFTEFMATSLFLVLVTSLFFYLAYFYATVTGERIFYCNGKYYLYCIFKNLLTAKYSFYLNEICSKACTVRKFSLLSLHNFWDKTFFLCCNKQKEQMVRSVSEIKQKGETMQHKQKKWLLFACNNNEKTCFVTQICVC